MSERYPGYDDGVKIQPEDRELRKLVREKFTNADRYVIEKHRFDLTGSDFNDYADQVKALLKQANSAGTFITMMNMLNLDQDVAVF